MESLLKWLDHIDKVLFVLIQHDLANSIFDKLMPVLRQPFTWIPLYAFVLYYSVKKTKKRVWQFIVLSLLTFAITDSVSARLLKPLFGRLRPCHEPELSSLRRGLVDCGGMYSMPSSHAANHFGLAAFWYFAILAITGQKWKWLWVWAAVVCFAQVYVGVHFPGDVLVGSVMGTLTGMGAAKLFACLWNRQQSLSSSPLTSTN